MEQQKTDIENTMLNLAFYNIVGASYIMQTLCKTAKNMALDQTLTPQAKACLKEEAQFTSKAVRYLGQAQEGYRTMMENLDQLEVELNKKIKPGEYNQEMADVLELVAADLAYMTATTEYPDRAKAFHRFIERKEMPKDFKLVYDGLRKIVRRFRKS